MIGAIPVPGFWRRAVLQAAGRAALGIACLPLAAGPSHAADADPGSEDVELIQRLIGGTPTASPRVHLAMPAVFGNGYTVPLGLDIDSPMTADDHVRVVHILAPRNPIIVVAVFRFTPQSGRAVVATRIRLAEPQNVIAVAEMSDGSLLMARTWVKVATNGCS